MNSLKETSPFGRAKTQRRRDAEFLDSGRRPVFSKQARQHRCELRAGLGASELDGAGDSDFGRLTHQGILAGGTLGVLTRSVNFYSPALPPWLLRARLPCHADSDGLHVGELLSGLALGR